MRAVLVPEFGGPEQLRRCKHAGGKIVLDVTSRLSADA